MKLSPACRIGVGFGSALLVLVAVVAASLWTTYCLRVTALSADHTLRAVDVANDLHGQLGVMQALTHSYLVTGDATKLAECEAHERTLRQDLQKLRDLNRDNPDLGPRLDAVESVVGSIRDLHAKLIPRRSVGGLTPAELLDWYERVTALNWQIHRAIDDEVEARDRTLLAGDSRRAKFFTTLAFYINSLGGIVGVSVVTAAAVITIRDARARWLAEHQLAHQASHDLLTGLPNRLCLYRNLDQAIDSARATGGSFAILLIDLDRFKEVNDTHGHRYGDLVLQEMKPRLRAGLRQTDLVARLGGDEFAILLPGADWDVVLPIAERVWVEIGRPIEIDGYRFEVGASIGIAIFPIHGQDAGDLLQRADVAMYACKRRRGGKPVFTTDVPTLDAFPAEAHLQVG